MNDEENYECAITFGDLGVAVLLQATVRLHECKCFLVIDLR